MATLIGCIEVKENGENYEVDLNLSEELYPYILHAMRMESPGPFEQALEMLKKGEIEGKKATTSGEES